MLFIIGAPRSGTTMLERMLSAHTHVRGGPEPHLLTPLAHLGPWDKVDKAPYDHILAAESQLLFIDQLPNGIDDYWKACRAYCDALYGGYMQGRNEPVCLDKTPAYALILPFMQKVFPDAKYVVLTRHPLAMFSSFANSFFDGDYQAAQEHNPLIERYVPALAAFLRQDDVPYVHVRYEDLVRDPAHWFEKICDYIGIPFEPDAIDYGETGGDGESTKGLGDPIGVQLHDRPTTGSVKKWAQELGSDPQKLQLMRGNIARVDPADLDTIGYPEDTLWAPLEELESPVPAPRPPKLNRYRLQRRAIVRLRALVRKKKTLHNLARRLRLTLDVLLREA